MNTPSLNWWVNLLSRGGSLTHESAHTPATKQGRKKPKNRIGHKEKKKRQRQHMAHLQGRRR